MDKLKNIEMFLLDMDGTIYLDDELIDGALDFINCLKNQHKKFVFLTNNSSNSAGNYVKKLNKIGIECDIDNVFTSGMAMGMYLNKVKPNCYVYLVGTKALEQELLAYNINIVAELNKNIDTVVVGFDRELTYRKLEEACILIADGAEFLATNVDLVCPTKNKRFIPDCGSICQMITNATGIKPYYIGKPNRDMVDILASKYGLSQRQIAVVGDRLYTDIATGINSGATAISVLTGETTKEDIAVSNIKPDFVFDSINDLFLCIK